MPVLRADDFHEKEVIKISFLNFILKKESFRISLLLVKEGGKKQGFHKKHTIKEYCIPTLCILWASFI